MLQSSCTCWASWSSYRLRASWSWYWDRCCCCFVSSCRVLRFSSCITRACSTFICSIWASTSWTECSLCYRWVNTYNNRNSCSPWLELDMLVYLIEYLVFSLKFVFVMVTCIIIIIILNNVNLFNRLSVNDKFIYCDNYQVTSQNIWPSCNKSLKKIKDRCSFN